jgi:hypothetical protein
VLARAARTLHHGPRSPHFSNRARANLCVRCAGLDRECADPTDPAPKAFNRSQSDVTLTTTRMSRHAAAAAKRAAAIAARDVDLGAFALLGAHVDDEADGVGYGRRRTEITKLDEASTQMERHGNVGAENGPSAAGVGYRHQTTDIHLANVDKSFRLQQQEANMAHANDEHGRPKYGRRGYRLTLWSADFDMLKV